MNIDIIRNVKVSDIYDEVTVTLGDCIAYFPIVDGDDFAVAMLTEPTIIDGESLRFALVYVDGSDAALFNLYADSMSAISAAVTEAGYR